MPHYGQRYPEPPPPPPERGVHTHDGFFLRMALGFGYGWVKQTFEDLDSTVRSRGRSQSVELLLGGTPAGGLVIGGGLITNNIRNLTRKVDGERFDSGDIELRLALLPVFLNYYFDPEQGWHVQGLVGYGGATSVVGGDESEAANGVVLALGGGYDGWVGEQWSLGAFARFSYARLIFDDTLGTQDYTFVIPTVYFTATHH